MKLGLPRFGHPAVANPLRDGATKVGLLKADAWRCSSEGTSEKSVPGTLFVGAPNEQQGSWKRKTVQRRPDG
jgi:hypothetical protein